MLKSLLKSEDKLHLSIKNNQAYFVLPSVFALSFPQRKKL